MCKNLLTYLFISLLFITNGSLSCGGSNSASGNNEEGGTGGGGGSGLEGASTCSEGGLPSFPGAEGFGACTTGARSESAQVVYVTNTNTEGEGSLQAALDIVGNKYIVFSTSGVIDGDVLIREANATIAGQTSPGGIIIHGGLICDNVYDPYHCQNIIVRHLRMRPGNSGGVMGDALRIGGASDFIGDHLSLENATDEATEISRSTNVTLQNSILAETLTDHNENGGLLINYSTVEHPLQNLSIHHNVYLRLGGRTPAEIACENNTDGDLTSNCDGHRLDLEISHNLVWDALNPLYYNRCTGTNEGNDCPVDADSFYVDLNWVGNLDVFKGSSDPLMMLADLNEASGNLIYASGNQIQIGTGSLTNYNPSIANASTTRLDYPGITNTSASELQEYVIANNGAFPRDSMDNRLMGYLTASVELTPSISRGTAGTNPANDAYSSLSGTAPTDTDQDGMPDSWESSHGLNPLSQDHNGTSLSNEGYSNLEVYLNELADQRVLTNT